MKIKALHIELNGFVVLIKKKKTWKKRKLESCHIQTDSSSYDHNQQMVLKILIGERFLSCCTSIVQ